MRALILNKQIVGLLLFLALLFSVPDTFWVTPFRARIVNASASSDWYYRNMSYRVEHNIIGTAAGNQTNYLMRIVIVNGTGTSNGRVYYTTQVNQNSFNDVRFSWYNTTSEQEEEIDYWREKVYSGNNVTFWVKIPQVRNVTDNIIYVYYGNSTAATTSSVNATFVRVINENHPVVLALPMDNGSGNKTYDQSGHNNTGTLYPTPVEVNDCDNTTDWSGTSLTSETSDKVEGSASVKDTITSPKVGTDYDTSYNPSGSWDWSSKIYITLWLKCNRASAAFTATRLTLVDTSNRERYWDIGFDADKWTKIEKKLDIFDEEDTDFDLSTVDEIIIRFRGADTTDFCRLVDCTQIDDSPQWVDGKFGEALVFDGQNDYVEVSHDHSLDITSAITIEAWIRTSLASAQTILCKCASGGSYFHGGYALEITNQRIQFGKADGVVGGGNAGNWDICYGTKKVTDGDWHHVSAVWDGTTNANGMKVYVDGYEDRNATAGKSTIGANNDSISIGYLHGGYRYFNGRIDEVHIYNRALTHEEISDLYNYYGYATTNYRGRILVRKRVSPEPSHGAWKTEVHYVPIHDIAIVSVVPSSTEVIKGNSINILVEAQNKGTETENFNITAYYDNNIIDTQTSISLEKQTKIVITFTWKTADVLPGNYNISARASIVPEENDTDDNILTDTTVKIIEGYPVAHFTYSPTNPFVNETVTFNATLSTPNGGTLVNYAWDFSDGFYGNGVIVYHNYSKTGTYNATLTVTDDEMVNNTVSVTITVFMHDISIVSVTPSTNEIYEGQTMNIAVVVQNNGNLTETFNVTVYANITIIQTQEVPNLVPNNQITLTFIWNTAEASLGHYTIKAEASIVPEETYAAQTITVHPPPSWYTPLITWLISVPPLIWVGINIPIILAALFWRGMIKVEIEKLPEPVEELKDQTNMLLQPLTEKDGRFIPLHQFLHQLLEKNPPPETIEFLQNTFPVIIHSLQENLIRKRSTRVRAKIVKIEDREKHRKRARNQKK